MKPYLFVLRSKDIDETKSFYQNLGFKFNQEQHAGGPLHYSTKLSEIVFEIYPCSAGEVPSNNRLGFEIPPETDNYQSIIEHAKIIALQTQQLGNGQTYCVVVDPDNRQIELVYGSKT